MYRSFSNLQFLRHTGMPENGLTNADTLQEYQYGTVVF
jgi:hypothetical protein